MKVCQICKKNKCKELIDFGNHPVCHKFSDGKQKEEKFSLALGQCQFCGLVQLILYIYFFYKFDKLSFFYFSIFLLF